MSPEARTPEAAQQGATALLWEEWKVVWSLPSSFNGDDVHKASCSSTGADPPPRWPTALLPVSEPQNITHI